MKKRILKSLFFINKPIHLILHVTNRCNLKCKTCFVDFDGLRGEELRLEEIEAISRYLNKLIWLDISGGEPFLREDLPDICARFNAKSITVPTNGFNPESIYETVKKLRSATAAEVNIALSLDGFETTNDDIRGKGSFKNCVKTLELLKMVKGLRLRVITVLCEKNYDEIIAFMKFIRGLDLDFHSINFRRGPKEDLPLYGRPSLQKLIKIKNDIFDIWNTYDYGCKAVPAKILKNYQRMMYEASLRVIGEERQSPRCLSFKSHLVVYANGNIAFCEMLPPFGNIRKAGIEEALKSEEAKIQRESIKERKCFCHHNCNFMDNLLLNPFNYPGLLKGII